MKFRFKQVEQHKSQFIKQAYFLTFVIIACLITYFWIDRPLAVLMLKIHPKSTKLGNADLMSEMTSLLYFIVLIIMLFYAYMRVTEKENRNKRLVATAGGISLCTSIAFFIKGELQYVLGRIPPRYGNSDALLFVKRHDLYGFYFFQVGSFPSGHMAVFTSALMITVFYYPKLKPFFIFALFVLASLLLFYNYHFLSDVIAGTYLGYLIAKVIYTFSVKDSNL